MKEDYVFITEPGEDTVHELKMVEELKEYQEMYHTGFHLTDKEAEIILGYMEGHDYMLGEVQGNLYRGDLSEAVGVICWEGFSMDDAIDAVCEWNYELILEADAMRNNPDDMIDFSKLQSRYESLKVEEITMDRLFDQTMYGRDIQEIATKLAGEFTAKLKPEKLEIETKDLEAAIVSVTEQIHQFGSGGRGR
ncbi:MAG: multidrug transporter [Mobilitalea sp.]